VNFIINTSIRQIGLEDLMILLETFPTKSCENRHKWSSEKVKVTLETEEVQDGTGGSTPWGQR
jgi:hypothetical protein